MKRILLIVLSAFVLAGAVNIPLYARKKVIVVKKRPHKKRIVKKHIIRKKVIRRKWKANKVATRRYINRTARILNRVKAVVKIHKVYTGNLLKAYRHQQRARALFMLKRFHRAFYQSRRARVLAWKARAANQALSLKEKKEVKELNNDGYSEIPNSELDKEAETVQLKLGNKKIENDGELVGVDVDTEIK